MPIFSSVLCCLNLNERPEELVPYVRDAVIGTKARLILAHVLPDRGRLTRNASDGEYAERIFLDGAHRMEEEVQAFAARHFSDFKPVVEMLEGDAGHALLRVVGKYCADLLILGSMSARGPLGFLSNRAAGDIIGRTRIPVLIVPNDLDLECTPDF